MYEVFFTESFIKELGKITKKNKILNSQIHKTTSIIAKNINHPSLRLHKLAGIDNWSVSVNKSIRIILNIEKEKVYLLRIGTHDEVY